MDNDTLLLTSVIALIGALVFFLFRRPTTTASSAAAAARRRDPPRQKAGTKANPGKYTHAEVNRHDQIDDIWLIFKGKVYDLTKWIPSHPGGESILQAVGCEDASEWFEIVSQHQDSKELIAKELDKYYIGDVIDGKM